MKTFLVFLLVLFTLFDCSTVECVGVTAIKNNDFPQFHQFRSINHTRGDIPISDKKSLTRAIRQTEASYEEGAEYEYEEEEEVSTPEPKRKLEEDNQKPPTTTGKPENGNGEDGRHGDGDEEEYYETYDENEEEREREREREEEESRKEEERREEERKEEERREEEERLDEDRRDRRKEEAAREDEEERLEEEKRKEAERSTAEEQWRLEEQRKNAERRQQEEYEASVEETEEEEFVEPSPPTSSSQPYEISDKEPKEADSMVTDDSQPGGIDIQPTVVPELQEDYEPSETDEQNGSLEEEERVIEEHPQHGGTPEPIPIEESGRHDLERYSSDKNEVEKTEESDNNNIDKTEDCDNNELEKTEESLEEVPDEPPSSRIHEPEQIKTTLPPHIDYTDKREEEEEVEYESSTEDEEVEPNVPSSTMKPEGSVEEKLDVTVPPTTPPQRPHVPFQPSLAVEESEETRDPNEYEVEPPSSSENELTNEPDHRTEYIPTQTPTIKVPKIPTTELVDGQVPGERERYHHQDLDLDEEEEEEEEEAELYEGRRFNEENRSIPPILSPSSPTQPTPVVRVDESSVTDLSREPHEPDLENEIDTSSTEMMTTSPPSSLEYDEDESPLPERVTSPTPILPATNQRPDPPVDDRRDQFFEVLSEKDISSHESSSSELHPTRSEERPIDMIPPTQSIYVDLITRRPEKPPRFEEIPKTHIECFPGYQLSTDGSECLDLNECDEGVCGSTQICSNLPGSYRCSCHPGFVKDFRNEKVCRDLNECEIGNGGCSQDCINTQGSFYCSCSDNFELLGNRRTCVRRPPVSTTSTTTTTTTTPRPTTTTTQQTTTLPSFNNQIPGRSKFPGGSSQIPPILVGNEDNPMKNCPTPPVPRGAGIAYLYCSRSPVGIHHRHSQLERRLIQDWTARKNKGHGVQNNIHMIRNPRSSNPNLRQLRRRRNLRRRPRQTTYSPGSMCELRCRSGFELRGHYTLHCNASTGSWQGTTNGFCQVLPKPDNQNLAGLSKSDVSPSNEIPRVDNRIPFPPYEQTSFENFQPIKPTFQPVAVDSWRVTSFRPIFHQLPPPADRLPITPPPPASRFSDPSEVEKYWLKPKVSLPITTTRRPYYNNYYPPNQYSPLTTPETGTITTIPTTPTTSRNSFIQLTYKFKTPWIKCPDDIRIDLQPNQNLAYVIIPQPQTNVDWWRQVTAEPSWAKGLETEIGPGKQRITFRARTSAPFNNSAECGFTLEIRDMDPPRVRECPESFTIRLNPGQSARAVTWLEPHFSDNVRISWVKKSHDPGVIMASGEHLINYEAKDPSDNIARCSFTVTVLPPLSSSVNGNSYQNTHYRKPFNSEGVTSPTTTTTSGRPEVHNSMRNVVCHVGKKGRRIVFLSRVVPRGCSEMSLDTTGDSVPGSYNTLNTVAENSLENLATSQISSVSYSSHDTPQSASAFGQALSNGRNANRMVHSTSSVTNGAHGTNSKSSSYAIAVSSSSRNFELPFLTDKQVYEEDFIVPTMGPMRTKSRESWNVNRGSEQAYHPEPSNGRRVKLNNGNRRQRLNQGDVRDGGQRKSETINQENLPAQNEKKTYFQHFDTWGTNNGLLRGP